MGTTGDQNITIGGNATFEKNIAGYGGGAIYLRSSSDNGSTGAQTITIEGDATFENNQAGDEGGAIYLRSDSQIGSTGAQTITIEGDATFENNDAGDHGGAISLKSNSQYGEGESTGAQTITIEGTAIFDNNNAGEDGGALSLKSYSQRGSVGDQTITIEGDATFENNAAGLNGGAISFEILGGDAPSQTLQLFGMSEFTDNYAEYSGGAISMQSTGKNGGNGYYGGGYGNPEGDGDSGEIGGSGAVQEILLVNLNASTRAVFSANEAGDFGGAIFMQSRGGDGGDGGDGGSLEDFAGGTLGGDGGDGGDGGWQGIVGLRMEGSGADLIFESNQSGAGGGAIFMGSVGGEGGTKGFGTLGDNAEDGISGDASQQILISRTFTFNKNNAGGGSGGAVNMYNSGATGGWQGFYSYEASTFTENIAGAAGGAVSMTNFGTVYSGGYQYIGFNGGATFLYNQAQYGRGGAIRMYNTGFEEGGYQVIEFGSQGMGGTTAGDATFIGNSASDDGGAISMYNVGEFGDSGSQLIDVIGDSQFSGNSSDSNGGAIRMENRSFEDIAGSQYLRVTGDASFIDNQATGNGGAIYMYSLGVDEVYNQTILIEGEASFVSNTADQLGAAIYMRNRVVSNSVAGSQIITFDSNVTFVNNVNNGTSEGAITMFTNTSETDLLDVTLAFVANTSDSNPSLHFISNHTGTFFYLVLDASLSAPTALEVIANGATATGPVTSGQLASGLLTGLTNNVQYKVYVVVKNETEDVSPLHILEFTASDVNAPTVSPISPLEIGGTTGTFDFTSTEAGDYYYLIVADGSGPVPSDEDIISAGLQGDAVAGNNPISVTGLDSQTSYTIYLVVKDSSGNKSPVSTGSFTTLDITPPTLTEVNTVPGGNTATFVFNSNEAGTYYYIIRESNQPAPDTAEILAGGSSANVSIDENSIPVTNLDSQRGYTIYVVVRDSDGNTSEVIQSSFTTVDITDPEISSPSTSSLTSTSVNINFMASEAGYYYYQIRFASDGNLGEEEIIFMGEIRPAVNGLNTISLNGLVAERTYRIHLMLGDARENYSEVSRLDFTTPAVQNNGGGGSGGDDFSELITEKRNNKYYLAKMIDNVSTLRIAIRAITDADAFITTNFDSQTRVLTMMRPNHVEFINQIIRTSGFDKFNALIAATKKTADDGSFDAAFELVYGQSYTDWYMNSAAPSFVNSIMAQGSDSLLKEVINFEILRALSSTLGSETNQQIMDSTMQRVLRDMLATDAGLQKLEMLVDSTKNTSDDFVRQGAFERIYGTSFSRWVESKAITWVKEALGIPNFKSSSLTEPKPASTEIRQKKLQVR